MYNGTASITGTARTVNETNVSIEISKIIFESQNITNIEYLSYLVPLISVIITGIIAYLNIKATSKNLFIQINQSEIVKSTRTLVEKIQTGNKKNITKFIESENSIYIPKSLRKDIEKILNQVSDNDLDSNYINQMKEIINDYLINK